MSYLRFPARTAAAAPTVNDDFGDGISGGSTWVDTSTTPDTGYVLVDNAVAAAVWQVLQGGSVSSMFGNGTDGAASFTNGGAAPTGSTADSATVFTLTKDVQYTTCLVDTGIIVNTAGYEMFINSVLSGSGTICDKGNNAVIDAAGAARTAANGGSTGASLLAGGAGRTSTLNGVAGSNAGAANVGGSGGIGGDSAGAQTGGPGGTATRVAKYGCIDQYQTALRKHHAWDASNTNGPQGGGGGGSGGCTVGTGTASSGGGGSSGGVVSVWAAIILFTGIIHADGGVGGSAIFTGNGTAGGGAGGGGGKAFLCTRTHSYPCTVRAAGGAGGAGANGGIGGGSGNTGTTIVILL